MDEEELNVAGLSQGQLEALQQYALVTNQEAGAAIPLLQKCEWNVQIAIARFFDGDPPNPEPQPSIPPPQPTRRQETLQNGFGTNAHRSRRRFEPAPRVSGPPESRLRQDPPLLLALLLTPLDVVLSLFARLYGVLSRLFPFLPQLIRRLHSHNAIAPTSRLSVGQPSLSPQAATSRFIRDFTSIYGRHKLPFLDSSYSRAYDIAKTQCKFLLVVPLSPEHDDTDRFIRNTLLAPSLADHLMDPSNNTLLWAGSVADPECDQVVRSLNITTFPSSVVIAHMPSISSTAMSVIARLTGSIPPSEFLATVQAAKMQHGGELDRARSYKAEQDATRSLREQQASAYERSLAADREKARVRKEAEMEKARMESQEQQRREQEVQHAKSCSQWKRWRAQSVSEEPAVGAKDAVRISLRLLNGERVTRRFAAESGLEEVYAFVECHDEIEATSGQESVDRPEGFKHSYPFRLVSPMPREVYDLEGGGTVKSRIGRSANLIAERIEDGEDEDDGDGT